MKTKFGKEFDEALEYLRENHKPLCGLPIHIKLNPKLKSKGLTGLAVFYSGKRWVIHLDPKQTPNEAVDTLLHEWAHCLQDEREVHDKVHHTDLWGTLYAQLYRGYHGK